MPKFVITWDMSGETTIEAATKEDALREFETWGTDEIFATNDNYDVDANTPDELKAKRNRNRYGDHITQLRQDIAEESRHG